VCDCINGSKDENGFTSQLQITGPMDADVVLIVKDSCMNIVDCLLAENGGSINLKNGTYTVVFYYGNKWSDDKRTLGLNGGFLEDESIDEEVITLENDSLLIEVD